MASNEPTVEDNKLMPEEKSYLSFTGRGISYSCPWPFYLPSAISYSLFVINTTKKRSESPTKEVLANWVTEKPDFPKFKANTAFLTWLGHASCLFTFYGDQEDATVRVLCDPVFKDFVGFKVFSSGIGSKRHIPPACQVRDLPEVHALCISHNHMDHMDASTLKELAKSMPSVRCFVPMGDRGNMEGFGFRHVTEMTWWDEKEEEFPLQQAGGAPLKVTFTPASHWSGRGANDRNCSLWGGFALTCGLRSAYFAGDTGYQDRIFKQIGAEYGPFDLAAIPIGCYEPREVFSVQHVCPGEAVQVHQDVGSRLSVGVHWGAFRMTTLEGVLQPPEDLQKAMDNAKIQGRNVHPFVAVKVGASVSYPVSEPEPEPESDQASPNL